LGQRPQKLTTLFVKICHFEPVLLCMHDYKNYTNRPNSACPLYTKSGRACPIGSGAGNVPGRHSHVTTLSKLFTHMCLYHSCSGVWYRPTVVMLCGWEDNRRFGLALVMHYRRSGFMAMSELIGVYVRYMSIQHAVPMQ